MCKETRDEGFPVQDSEMCRSCAVGWWGKVVKKELYVWRCVVMQMMVGWVHVCCDMRVLLR